MNVDSIYETYSRSTKLKLINNRRGNLAMYSIVFILCGVLMAMFIFFPQYMNTRSGIYGISCRDIRKKISVAIEDHDVNNSVSAIKPGEKVNLDLLKEKGFLDEIRLCPEKGIFMFDNKGRVVCTVHKDGDVK